MRDSGTFVKFTSAGADLLAKDASWGSAMTDADAAVDSVPALAPADLSSGYTETKILGSRPDRSHWSVKLHSHQRQAFPRLRHRTQEVIVFFRPALVVI